MADRIPITAISLMVLLLCFWSCSAAPTDTTERFLPDTTEMNVDETTTELVTEMVETTTDWTSVIFPCPDCGATGELDAVTIQPLVESATQLDLESVIIDLGVDRLKLKDPVVGSEITQSVVSDEEAVLTTEIAQVVKSSTEILAEPVEDAQRDTTDSPSIQEKVETLADADGQAEKIQEETSTEFVTAQPEADSVIDSVIDAGAKVDLKNQTKQEVATTDPAILSDPENDSQDTTPPVQQKVEIGEGSETTPMATTTSSEEAQPTESATLRPETDSEIHILLKADFKTPTDERNEGTEAISIDDDVITIQPESFDEVATTESVSVAVLKNKEEVAESTPTMLDDTPIESTNVPPSGEDEKSEEFLTVVADVVEDVTQTTVDFTDSGSDATDSQSDPAADEIVLMEPQLVKIFDPSVDVEATTFLAEANMQTEWDVTAATESFYQADGVEEKIEEDEEALTTTDESVALTTEPESRTESVTESSTEVMGETKAAALPVGVELSSPPSLSSGADEAKNTPATTKKRSYKGYKVYRVILPTEDSVRRILSMEDEPGVEFWADPRLLLRPRGLFVTSAADVMVAPKTVPDIEAVFREARLTYTVLIDDVHKSIAKENPSGPSFARSQSGPSGQHRLTWERYHRLADINSYLDYLKEAHPDWVQVVPIGKSSQGRPIHVIKLSRSRQPDGVEPSQKKAILVDAGMHANEWITPAALTWMINELVENADSYNCILDRFDWYFVPMVNPDGYEYSHAVDRMWRKTRRNYTSTLVRSSARKLRVDADDEEQCVGADINRNFEFHWRKGGSSSNVCSPAFAGVKPFSEPESRALANFMLKQRSRIAMYISLHSYSQMWLLPWGFAEARPQDFSELYSLAKIGARALQRVHNTSFLIGSVPDLLALASGTSQDWAKGVAGVRYSYTVEMRDAGERGMILPAQQIVPTAEETWAGIYAASVELAHRLYDELPSCSPF